MKQISGAIVVALFVALMFAGCATMVPQRRQVGLIEGVVRLPFAMVGGAVTVLTGYNIVPTEADIRINEYAVKQYGDGTRDYYVCLNGAYGSVYDRRSGYGGYNSFDDYYHQSGLQKGRHDREQLIWQTCEVVGRGIGNQGM